MLRLNFFSAQTARTYRSRASRNNSQLTPTPLRLMGLSLDFELKNFSPYEISHVTLPPGESSHVLVAGHRIEALSFVAELVKSFDSPTFSKVLTTSATNLLAARGIVAKDSHDVFRWHDE